MNFLGTTDHYRHTVVTFTDWHEALRQLDEMPPDGAGGAPSGLQRPSNDAGGDAAAQGSGQEGGSDTEQDRARQVYDAGNEPLSRCSLMRTTRATTSTLTRPR